MKHIFIFTILISIFISSCYKRPITDYNYSNYNRQVGKDGGTITFYANYAQDSGLYFQDTTNNKLLEITVPAGALDSDMIFNFYQYQDFSVADELSKGLASIGSKFIYFVPIPAADGYHEHDNADLTYHTDIKFNSPVSVTYHYNAKTNISTINDKKLQYYFYYWLNSNYKLYKIKIPKYNEWSEDRNIYVQWNQQGYPIGYYANDLSDIILGYWFPKTSYENVYSSIVNWQECSDYSIDTENQTVTFNIESSDYIYVLARVIQIDINKIHGKIKTYISNNFDSEIQRAAFVNGQLEIILENGVLLSFSFLGDLISAKKYNIPTNQIPLFIKNYITTNYPNTAMQGNVIEYLQGDTIFSINLVNSTTLLFELYDGHFTYSGKTEFTDNMNDIPASIIDYINNNYPNAKINSITNYSMFDQQVVNVYLTYENKNIRIFFNENGQFENLLYYGLKTSDITSDVTDYLNQNFANQDIITITHYVSPDSSYYSLTMTNNTQIDIKDNGSLMSIISFVQPENIPSEVMDVIIAKYTSSHISSADYIYYYGQEKYSLYFLEDLYLDIKADGTIEYATSSNYLDLDSIVKINFSSLGYTKNDFEHFEYYFDNITTPAGYYYYVYLNDYQMITFDNDGNYISTQKSRLTDYYKKIRQKYIKPQL